MPYIGNVNFQESFIKRGLKSNMYAFCKRQELLKGRPDKENSVDALIAKITMTMPK